MMGTNVHLGDARNVLVAFKREDPNPIAPQEPDWKKIFSDGDDIAIAKDLWRHIVTEMQDANTIVLANSFAIRRLVEFHIQYERASRHIAEHGAIVPAQRRGNFKQSIFWQIMRQASDHITALEAELGIAPVRRGKALKVNRQKKAARAADSYLSRKS